MAFGGEGFFVAQTEPVIGCVGLACGREGRSCCGLRRRRDSRGLRRWCVAGLRPSSAATGSVEELAEQVEQSGLDGGDGVDGGAQVEGLQAASFGVAVGESVPDRVEDAVVGGDVLADRRAGGTLRGRWRIFSPPGTSPTPVWPALSVRMTRLRVKNGAWAPLRLSSMESWPATGMTRMAVTMGVGARDHVSRIADS